MTYYDKFNALKVECVHFINDLVNKKEFIELEKNIDDTRQRVISLNKSLTSEYCEVCIFDYYHTYSKVIPIYLLNTELLFLLSDHLQCLKEKENV